LRGHQYVRLVFTRLDSDVGPDARGSRRDQRAGKHHARTAITLDVYTHLFERARHAADVRAAMAASRFAHILAEATATQPTLREAATRRRIGLARRAQRPIVRRRIRCQTRERRAT
jgi:hypothetical protein